jgi:hypothetical protein
VRPLAKSCGALAVGLIAILYPFDAEASSHPSPVIGVYPGYAGITTLRQHHFTYVVPAGTKVSDSIGVVNFTNHAVRVNLYPADLLQAKGDGFAPAQQGQTVSGVGQWFAISNQDVTIAPHQNTKQQFRLKVPLGTTPGVYGAAIVVSYVTPGSGVNNGFTVVNREALIAQVTVPGEIHPGVQLSSLRVRHVGGVEFAITVRNIGNVLFTVTGVVRTPRFAGSTNSFTLRPRGVYVVPGGSVTLDARWPHPSPVVLGQAQAIVMIHVHGQPARALSSSIVSVRLVATWVIGVAVGVIALLVTAGLTRRRWQRWIRERKDERREVRTFKRTRKIETDTRT